MCMLFSKKEMSLTQLQRDEIVFFHNETKIETNYFVGNFEK